MTAEWHPSVPFVCCASQGGPYEDVPFVAGFQAGEVRGMLLAAAGLIAQGAEVSYMTTVARSLLKQIDLIAMDLGWVATERVIEDWDDETREEWAAIDLRKARDVAS